MDIGEPSVNPVVAHGQLFVVDAELVQDGGVNVVAGSRVVAVGGAEAPFVAFAIRHAALDAPAGEPVCEHKRVVIPALAALGARHPAELSRPEDERVVEHAALFEVENQRS